MAGIFDFLGTDFESPKTQAILSLGLGLLSGKDPSFAGALGQAGQQAMGVYGQARQGEETRKLRQQQQAMTEMQMDQLKRQQAMEQARQQALRDAVIPGMPAQLPASMDARDIGLPGEAPVQATPAGFDMNRYAMNLLQGGDSAGIGVLQSLQKEAPKPFTRKRDEDLLVPDGKGGVRVLMQGEADPTKGSPLGQLIAEMNALPPGDPRRAIYLQAITKATTHPDGVSVSYGAPIAGVNPETNKTEFFRPDNKGGMRPTGIQPAPREGDGKQPAEIQRMSIAAQTMSKLLTDYEALLKQYNPRDPMVQASPAVRANFQSLMKNIQLQFKELQALGALAGPDLALMEQAITDPFTFKGAYYGRDGLQAQIAQARNLIQQRTEASNAVTRGNKAQTGESPPSADDDPLGLRRR